MIKKRIALIILVIIGIPLSIILYQGLIPPQPFNVAGDSSIVLTDTEFLQLFTPSGVINLLFGETSGNPYIYGWGNNDLYFKDAWGRQYMLKEGESTPKKISIDNPNFLRQEKETGCNLEHAPDYKSGYKPNNGSCYKITQANTTIEAWMYEFVDPPSIISFQARVLVITHDGERLVISEPRSISDIVISEDGKYVAITAADPPSYSFEPTDIHIIELKTAE